LTEYDEIPVVTIEDDLDTLPNIPNSDEIPLVAIDDADNSLELALPIIPNSDDAYDSLELPNITNLSWYLNKILNDSTLTIANLSNEDVDTLEDSGDEVIFVGAFKKGGVPQHRSCQPGCCRP
jgi:hypothetical protein